MRNRRELNAKLKGTTLGDADVDVDNTKAWLKKSKKKERELAAKRLKEIESMDQAVQDEYDESACISTVRGHILTCSCAAGDLEGLKVGHDFTDMDEGEARILTLKDSRILDNEGLHQFCRTVD